MTKIVTVQSQQKWEYCFHNRKTESALLVVLNKLGQDGWDLVDTVHHKDPLGDMCWTAFLKRPSVGQQTATPEQQASSAGAEPSGQATLTPSSDASGGEYKLKSE